MPVVAPYGAWKSPITAQSLVERTVGLGQLSVDGDAIHWVEARPAEGGRLVVVRRDATGTARDVLPAPYSARTRVHEYGGVSYVARHGVVWFANFADQRVYRVGHEDPEPTPVTPEPSVPAGMRFGDLVLTPDGAWVLAVRETHLDAAGEVVVNDVVALPAGGGEPRVLVGGHDFFAAPRPSPDGTQLAWLSWDHPDMPWDGTELWVASLTPDLTLGEARLVAGGPYESVTQPRWSPDGRLHFVSDRTGWWNLYVDDGAHGIPLAPHAGDFAGPAWTLGQSDYTFLADGTAVVAWREPGVQRLGLVSPAGLVGIPTTATSIGSLTSGGGDVLAVVGSPTQAPAVVRLAVPSGAVEVLRRSREEPVDHGYVSVPAFVEFPTGNGLTAYAYLYRPANRDFTGPGGERPPLVVMSHGGPTAAATTVLNPSVQFWTSRGFAVVDVDYGGSSPGYGRAYQERIRGHWGIVDVDDCVNAARWLAARGEVDGDRMVIRGGSAGGYTTLAVLAFREGFAAGASHYGVADASALARDTHKFESRYLDGLIGPWPDAQDVYHARSPIHHVDGIDCPLILFQGLEDRIVPPAQSEGMAEALRARDIPVAYLAFPGEQHGFRRAETIVRVAEAELWFYGRVLGFTPADAIEPVPIAGTGASSN